MPFSIGQINGSPTSSSILWVSPNKKSCQLKIRVYRMKGGPRVSLKQKILFTISLFVTVAAVILFQNFTTTNCKAPLPRELQNKLFVGYQGWFRTPNDKMNNGWFHWGLNPLSATSTSTHLAVDLWPDVTEYSPASLTNLQTVDAAYATGSVTQLNNGAADQLFSSALSSTTDLHMQWMEQYAITGAFLQRFVSDLNNPSGLTTILNAEQSAQKFGRKVVITYDITSAASNPNCYVNGGKPNSALGSAAPNFSISQCIKADWTALVNNNKILSSPAYLNVTIGNVQKPLVEIWGFGFNSPAVAGAPAGSRYIYNTQDALSLIQWFHSQGVAVMGGVPTFWRTQNNDSLAGSAWTTIYNSFEIISPWKVGRETNASSIDSFAQSTLASDICAAQSKSQGYMPVIYAGYSFFNTPRARGDIAYTDTSLPLNQTPRDCGRFLWRQFYDDNKQGVESYYLAMFDEVDEGTAIFKTVPTMATAPAGAHTLALNADGCNLPSDWYLQLAQQIAANISNKSALPFLPLAIPNNIVKPGTILIAPNRFWGPGFSLVIQNDGNLVMYDARNSVLWASNTSGKCSGACQMNFQTDGNLVLYDSRNIPYWATNTAASEIGPLGNALVLKATAPYLEITDSSGDILWSPLQTFDSGFTLNMNQFVQMGTQPGSSPIYFGLQNDGNLVLYSGVINHQPISPLWASKTEGKCTNGCKMVFQSDGNIVLYNASNIAYWASGTASSEINSLSTTLKINRKSPHLQLLDLYGAITWAAQ